MKKWKKWLSVSFLCGLLGIGTIAGTSLTAKGAVYERWDTVAEEERTQSDSTSPSQRAATSSKAWQKINGVCYNGSGVEIPGAITRGIDVSEHQGTINWQKVKSSNVDFAFVRISYGTTHLDETYAYNMEQAAAAGVPVGTYVYSTATTTAGALNEAKLAIQKMKGYKVSYPVVYDIEYSAMQSLSKKQVAQLALAFCNEVKKAGYYPMVYCNTNWYSNYIDWSLLSGLDVWIARYGDKIQAPDTSSYKYTIWQATDGDGGGTLNSTAGLIGGIAAGNTIDIDFGYVDYTKKITPRTQPLSSYTPSTTPDVGNGEVVLSGWAEEDGKTYYYADGEKVKGWKKIDGKYYYFNRTDGHLYKNKLLSTSKMAICYVDENGARVTDTLFTWKNKTYYMGSDGYAVNGLKNIDGKVYYFRKSAKYMVTNTKIISSSGNISYFGSDGVRYAGGFYKIVENGKTNYYYFGDNGRAYKGWHTINGKKYYFYKGTSQKSGIRAQSITLTSSSGIVSVFDKDGVCVKQYKK